jgi:hypothetical protein
MTMMTVMKTSDLDVVTHVVAEIDTAMATDIFLQNSHFESFLMYAAAKFQQLFHSL